MALRYTGHADPWSANITIFGDGTSTTVVIDLSKPPFSVDFTANQPSLVYEATGLPSDKTMSLNGNILTITFNTAPPAASFGSTRGGAPNILINPRFVYG